MYEIELYEKSNGNIPVKDFIDNLTPKMKAKALHDISLLEQHGFMKKTMKTPKKEINKAITYMNDYIRRDL